ncbi:MAG: ATP-binding protein, partial [Acidimicrobiia bacterium]
AGVNNTFALALLAEIYLRQERLSEGLAVIEDAQKMAVTQGELFWQAELFRLKGEFLLGQTDQSLNESAQCFCKALEIARSQNAKMLELRAATSLARLWKKLNKLDDAKSILNSVYSGFTEGFGSRDLLEAKTLLEQLTA